MKLKIMLLLTAAVNIHTVFGHNTFKAVVKDDKTKEPLAGATVQLLNTTKSITTDANEFTEIKNVPD